MVEFDDLQHFHKHIFVDFHTEGILQNSMMMDPFVAISQKRLSIKQVGYTFIKVLTAQMYSLGRLNVIARNYKN